MSQFLGCHINSQFQHFADKRTTLHPASPPTLTCSSRTTLLMRQLPSSTPCRPAWVEEIEQKMAAFILFTSSSVSRVENSRTILQEKNTNSVTMTNAALLIQIQAHSQCSQLDSCSYGRSLLQLLQSCWTKTALFHNKEYSQIAVLSKPPSPHCKWQEKEVSTLEDAPRRI